MVLTRSEKNRRLALGIDDTAENMENVPNTTVGSVFVTTAPVVTSAIAPTMITTAAVGTPAVQQFEPVARDGSLAGASHVSATSIASPEYSSITPRDERQESRLGEPGQPQGAGGANAVNADSWRDDFSRQLQQFQRSLQDIARAIGQQGGQTTATNHNAPASAPAPAPPGTGVNYLDDDPNRMDPSYGHPFHFRPVRAPQHAQGFGYNSSPINDRPDFYHSPGHRVDLSKWGLKFDGTSKSMSAEDFIFRLDTLRRDYGCTFTDVLRSFHLLLDGQALDWFWNLRKLTPLRTWQDLETAFLMQYRRFESEFQVQKKIMDRRQMPQESFEDFYNAVIRLRNQQRSPYSEADLVEIMRSNLKPALSHLLFSVRVTSLSDFCQQAKRAESLLSNQRTQYQPRNFPPQRVSELAYEGGILPDTYPEVEALAASSSYTCWNCRQHGHGFMDCPSPNRRVFCFRCGRDGVVTPKCPNCQGNLVKSGSYPGRTRSTQT